MRQSLESFRLEFCWWFGFESKSPAPGAGGPLRAWWGKRRWPGKREGAAILYDFCAGPAWPPNEFFAAEGGEAAQIGTADVDVKEKRPKDISHVLQIEVTVA